MVMEKVDNKKFTEEELKEIRTIKDGMANISQILGQIRLQQIQIEKNEKETLDKYNEILAKESELAKKLETKYGRGTLDITTGEFIPSSQ